MKSLKAAAVVAGSVALAGVTAPAFAYDAQHLPPMSLNGGLAQLTEHPPGVKDLMPLQHQSDALDTENKDSVLSSVKGATTTLNQRGLLGGLPLR
ncbi:hypothetical protein [Streptomyces rubradiris]|uniref:Secreted protein n=1 Tax=Streptomyces rubradiris TaxID=285531 RepID=A0ABQ3RP73_STRRR|nr:hypothetical protein [Streptomyces rubradiris]GHH12128.1 hypothetical protein GCM10018792_37210 [Streptomyces rubradiris]GHI57652.1 hypothetical protein Srubr_74980 [Streptomyces rubradiris]